MADLEREKLSEKDIIRAEKNDMAKIEMVPEEEYEKALNRRKKISIWGLVILIAVELTLAGGLEQKIQAEDL